MKAKSKKKSVAKKVATKRGRPKKVKEEKIVEIIQDTPTTTQSEELPQQTILPYPKLRASFPDLIADDIVGIESEVIKKVCAKTGRSYDEIQALMRG